ncbi:MAG: DNA-formamidopyrimidine glycosylase [Chloroflexi bacterium]|nr:DNA-formamidopyrimidine glycosylase [Chloroflexota bacterium]
MPELPEVETIVNDLRPELVGSCFTGVSISWHRMVLQPSVSEFQRRLPGQVITEIARRGKYLIFRLASGESLILHLRMTGSLLLQRKGKHHSEPLSYITAIFSLDNGTELLFTDRRKLGTVSLVPGEAELEGKLGPEPLGPTFTPKVLSERLNRHKAPIKAVLCDQEVIAGIGNMYADEALFLARIHPLRAAGSLNEDEIKRLHHAIREVLRNAIGRGGASISDYRRPGGETGSQQNAFYVAHRGGETCKVCATPIERIPVRNRGTYFCPRCQQTTCS